VEVKLELSLEALPPGRLQANFYLSFGAVLGMVFTCVPVPAVRCGTTLWELRGGTRRPGP